MKPIIASALLSFVSVAIADNTTLFNQALQAGQSNQVNMGLNQGSTIDSYGQTNKFDAAVAANANAGNANAQPLYNNSQGTNANPNYLYNAGTQQIQDCLNKTDPLCTTFNKYGDKNTQAQFQAYSQGVSEKYWISTTPDPSDATCSYIHTKTPINSTTYQCTAGLNSQSSCTTTILPYSNYIPPVPVDGTVVVSASNSTHVGSNATISLTLIVTEALTRQNLIIASVSGSSPDLCGADSRTFNGNLGLGASGSQTLANSGTYGCNGGNKYIQVLLNPSPGCDGNGNCNLYFTVNTGWGKDGQWHNGTVTYQAHFTKQTLSKTDTGVNLNDQCAGFNN